VVAGPGAIYSVLDTASRAVRHAFIPKCAPDCNSGPPIEYQTADPSQPLTGAITAHVAGNTFISNGFYAIAVALGLPFRSDPRKLVFDMTLSFESDTFQNNHAALFSFTEWDVSLFLAPILNEKCAEDSTYRVMDVGGGLAGFDYDNPRRTCSAARCSTTA